MPLNLCGVPGSEVENRCSTLFCLPGHVPFGTVIGASQLEPALYVEEDVAGNAAGVMDGPRVRFRWRNGC